MPYLIPTSTPAEESTSSEASCLKLLKTFVPANGLDQTNGSPTKEFKTELSMESFKHKSERLSLLYKFSVHPRESIRNWAETQLIKFTHDDARFTVIEEKDRPTIFPWRQASPHFIFTPTRALLLSRHELMTSEMANFLVHFKLEPISAKLINHILSNIPDPSFPCQSPAINQLLTKIASTHLPNAKRVIAKNKKLNWRVLDALLEDGLPLHSLDVIHCVDWDLYSKHAHPKCRAETIKRLKRFAGRNSAVSKTIKNWNFK